MAFFRNTKRGTSVSVMPGWLKKNCNRMMCFVADVMPAGRQDAKSDNLCKNSEKIRERSRTYNTDMILIRHSTGYTEDGHLPRIC